MFNMLHVIHFDSALSNDVPDQLVALLAARGESLPCVRASSVGRTLPRALNGGQLMWRVAFASEGEYWNCVSSNEWRSEIRPVLDSDRVSSVDSVAYRVDFSNAQSGRDRDGLWRCLVFSVEADASAGDVRQLERDLLLMPQHVSVIRNWALGRVVTAHGRRRWSHVWEQEFDDAQGLEGEYMTHPIHWGLVDGWFDPESPQRIVDPFLIHAAFAIREAIIA